MLRQNVKKTGADEKYSEKRVAGPLDISDTKVDKIWKVLKGCCGMQEFESLDNSWISLLS